MIIRPQRGPQEQFLSSAADIAIYGGAAGGGKSFGLLLEPLRHVTSNPGFLPVCFRRTTPQIRNPGGLWDQSFKLYSHIRGTRPLQQELEWRFAGAGRVKFAHLEHEKTAFDWQGSEVPLLCFDELTHFTAAQFWYLLSRNRSMCGVRPYVRATCNPDPDSFVAELIAWWLDPDTGLPVPARAAALRWFVRVNDELIWADDPAELLARFPDIPPKSLTFVPARLEDNAALMAADPGYRANLLALPSVERERLQGGNWKIRPAAGLYFQRRWVQVIDAAPAGLKVCRGWDLAGTQETGHNDPDWTAGTKIGRTADGRFFVLDHRFLRGSPAQVEQLLFSTATQDGLEVTIGLAQDPGQAGKSQILALTRLLSGFTVRSSPEPRADSEHQTASQKGAKITRFGPFSAQAEAGNVYVLRGEWNERWFAALEGFPDAKHDDDADSTARAFNTLAEARPALAFVSI